MKGVEKVFLIVALVFTLSCSTEVDLEDDWQDITVVYGLMDQSQSQHFIKINKTFLGEGNALDWAVIRDSSEYDPTKINAYIQEKLNGNIVRTFPLKDTEITTKEPGLFYYPAQTVYYFNASDLDQEAEYKLTVEVGDDPGTAKLVTANTPLIKSFPIIKPSANPGVRLAFAFANSSVSNNYPVENVEWNAAVNGKRYEAAMILHYIEVNTSNDSIPREISWNLGVHKAANLNGSESFLRPIAGENFFQWVNNKITSTPELNAANVTHRIFRGIDFKVTVAGEDLNTYMELNEPVTGIVQERPVFTNVDNGIGIFSTRFTKEIERKWLSQYSIEELYGGQYTSSLKFCSDSLGLWSNNDQHPSWCQ